MRFPYPVTWPLRGVNWKLSAKYPRHTFNKRIIPAGISPTGMTGSGSRPKDYGSLGSAAAAVHFTSASKVPDFSQVLEFTK